MATGRTPTAATTTAASACVRSSRRPIPTRTTGSGTASPWRPTARPWRSVLRKRAARRPASAATRSTTPPRSPARSTCSPAAARRGSSRPTSRRPNTASPIGSAGASRAVGRWLDAAVGAFGERSGSSGINGDQTSNSVEQAGAAYVFARSGTTWSQQAYVKPPIPSSMTRWLHRRALGDGSTLAISASGRDSAASASAAIRPTTPAQSAGAVYVFTRSGVTWSQQAYVRLQSGVADIFGRSLALSATARPWPWARTGGQLGDRHRWRSVQQTPLRTPLRSMCSARSGAQGASKPTSGFHAAVYDQFGSSVALRPTARPWLSARCSNHTAYVFTRSGATWSQHALIQVLA